MGGALFLRCNGSGPVHARRQLHGSLSYPAHERPTWLLLSSGYVVGVAAELQHHIAKFAASVQGDAPRAVSAHELAWNRAGHAVVSAKISDYSSRPDCIRQKPNELVIWRVAAQGHGSSRLSCFCRIARLHSLHDYLMRAIAGSFSKIAILVNAWLSCCWFFFNSSSRFACCASSLSCCTPLCQAN